MALLGGLFDVKKLIAILSCVLVLVGCDSSQGPPHVGVEATPSAKVKITNREQVAPGESRCPRGNGARGGLGDDATTVELWYSMPLHNKFGEGLVAVQRQISATRAVATATLKAWLKGPTCAEKERRIRSSVPEGTRLRGVSISDGVATVDLTRHFERTGLGTVYEGLLLEQLAWTITQFPSVERALLKIDGHFKEAYMGHGYIVNEEHPLTRR